MKTKEKKFSEYLQEFRNTYGFTQQQAADALGMSVRMYVGYENEEYDPKGKRLQKYLSKLQGYAHPDEPVQNLASEPSAVYRENELLRDIIKAKDELIAILREQLNNQKS